ncbi:hypothetical protein STAS_04456 [Striga asiatica]|uniref:Uncharacterized protein n=1 Tax=Striga asiatica TaxID=4170 RepID=A0A5A7P792_STRAF|nr:hypothetical protein STAS_04456 [Striga asiatica]
MSWLRSAVNRAVEVGGNRNLSRVVRSYADTVVNQAGQAVVGGAKLFQDRIGARNFQNYKLAVKQLEEVSVSCRGIERVQLLRRWLVALKEIERLKEDIKSENLDKSGESYDSQQRPNVVMYYDPDIGEPMNFRDIFLRSQALEGITLSLILEEPIQEELILLQQIFRLCLLGDKEAQDVTVNYVQELANTFATYNEEILTKREELLQYAQDAIAGLKVNAEIVRIDSEASNIHKKLDEMRNQLPFSDGGEKSSDKAADTSTENLKEALEHFKLCSRLEELLLQKKLIKNWDSPAAHSKKIDKLKVLSESLASSALKAEKRISDNRMQKEEALKFRVNKTSEMSQLEKELTAEIKDLQNKKDELEDELKKVTTALISAHARLHNAREERDQFDEASSQIIQHFKLKDDELSRSVASYRAEAEVCNKFVNFLDSTWVFQSSHADQKEKRLNDELERHEEYFVDWTISFLTTQKDEVASSISTIRDIVENLKGLYGIPTTDEKDDEVNARKTLEEQYHTQISKLTTTFGIIDSIKIHFSTQEDEDSSTRFPSGTKPNAKVNELLDVLESIKLEYESIKRPRLQHEPPPVPDEAPPQPKLRAPRIPFLSPRPSPDEKPEPNTQSGSDYRPKIALPLVRSRSANMDANYRPSDAETQFSKLKFELELDEGHSRRSSMDILDWEFDEHVEKEPEKSVQ